MITADQKDKIIEMWEQGMSGSKIGDNLNLTRNSVIGFVNRLKRSGHVFKRDEKDQHKKRVIEERKISCLLYTSPSPRDRTRSRMPSSA